MISQKSSPVLGQVAVEIPPLNEKRLKPSQSESRISALKSLTRDMGLRIQISPNDDQDSVLSEEPISPQSMMSALDKIHVTHMDGVDILYNSISKELHIVREKIEQNNKQSTWRQIAGLITTIIISILFNIFVFPKFSAGKCTP